MSGIQYHAKEKCSHFFTTVIRMLLRVRLECYYLEKGSIEYDL